jgi:hypothetical protein
MLYAYLCRAGYVTSRMERELNRVDVHIFSKVYGFELVTKIKPMTNNRRCSRRTEVPLMTPARMIRVAMRDQCLFYGLPGIKVYTRLRTIDTF